MLFSLFSTHRDAILLQFKTHFAVLPRSFPIRILDMSDLVILQQLIFVSCWRSSPCGKRKVTTLLQTYDYWTCPESLKFNPQRFILWLILILSSNLRRDFRKYIFRYFPRIKFCIHFLLPSSVLFLHILFILSVLLPVGYVKKINPLNTELNPIYQ